MSTRPGTDEAKPALPRADILRRLKQHENADRLLPGTPPTRAVPGGKTTREIAEHQRIQGLTGGPRASISPAVAGRR